MGKAFYKGGFEPRMTKKEASLILSLRYVVFNRQFYTFTRGIGSVANCVSQRAIHHQGQSPQGPPHAHAAQPPRPRRQPVSRDQSQRGKGAAGQNYLTKRLGRMKKTATKRIQTAASHHTAPRFAAPPWKVMGREREKEPGWPCVYVLYDNSFSIAMALGGRAG